jgi:DNA-binding NarL/FixJ family response regulator
MRLMIVEDSLLIREGLAALLTRLGHVVVATVTRAEQVLGRVEHHLPDVVVMDIRIPPTNTDEGLRLAVTIRANHARMGVLVLSQHADPTYAARLLDAGDRVGYLLKDRLLDERMLDDAIRRVAAGGVVIDPTLVTGLLDNSRLDDRLTQLTERESDVLALMAQGLSDRGIAARLSVAVTTVGTHVQSVFRKLDLPSQATHNRRVAAVLTYLGAR